MVGPIQISIQKATVAGLHELAQLALKLWPDHTVEELEDMFRPLLKAEDAAIFMYYEKDAIAFAQCQLRTDYVEGTQTSPVGYLEGIFVDRPFRRRGIAKHLCTVCETWARERGCTEFASDCELTNTESLLFHLKLGFIEANRIICFTKTLD